MKGVGGELGDGGREFPEGAYFRINCALKRSHFCFVLVAGIQKRDIASFIQPLAELLGRDFPARTGGGIHSGHPKGNDFSFDFDEHPSEGLVGTGTFLGLNRCAAWNGADEIYDWTELVGCAGKKKVDTLWGEENGAFKAVCGTGVPEVFTPRIQIG